MTTAGALITVAELDAKIEAIQAQYNELRRERDRIEREIRAVRAQLHPLVALKRLHNAEQASRR